MGIEHSPDGRLKSVDNPKSRSLTQVFEDLPVKVRSARYKVERVGLALAKAVDDPTYLICMNFPAYEEADFMQSPRLQKDLEQYPWIWNG